MQTTRSIAAPSMTAPLGAALLLATAGLATPASGAISSWNTGSGSWNTAANWSPNLVPDIFDTVRIGNMPGVQNSTVLLQNGGGAVVESLEITSGMTLDLNGGEFGTFGDVAVSGNGSRIIARPQPLGPNAHDFSGNLKLGAGTFFEMHDDVPVRLFSSVGDASRSSGTISGRGIIDIYGDGPFQNNGVIDPDANGGITINQNDPIGGLHAIDLDGTAGTGHLNLNTVFSQLHIQALSLTDSFSGDVSMVPGALLDMDLTSQWSVDANGAINVAGFGNPAAASQISGSDLSFGGSMSIGANQGHLRVLSNTTFQPTASVTIGATDHLEMDGTTTVLGGAFDIGQGGVLDFDGPTSVQGGTFSTPTDSLADGGVYLNGPTTWNSATTIAGAARQNGNATVNSALGATINATRFDMDGASNDTHWAISSSLVVNTDHLGSSPVVDSFHGSMTIGGGFLGKLTMNVADGAWLNYGHLTLSGDQNLFMTRLAGSGMQMHGDLEVTSGKVQIASELLLSSLSTVSIGPASAVLRTTADTWVQSGAEFSGLGTLRNGATAEMIFSGGLSLNQVGFQNDGVFEIGIGEGSISAGVASVDRLVATASATWNVTLGGYLAGDEHDLLLVSGGAAALDGMLEVALADLGGGVFLPQVGDEFTILKAVGGVTGAFLNSPTSMAGGLTFEWSVIYNPTSVVLRLDNVVPAPSGVALMAAACGFGAMRRRRA